MNNHNQVEQFILSQWADELSRKLDRPREHILQYGLSTTDFPLNEELKLTFPDESLAHFRHGFFVTNSSRRQLAVFTEHCGYHVFPVVDTVVERIIRERLTQE
ncbi:MAG: hypothetical protein ACLFVO_18645 [Chloroflexaceae bacterium]